MDILIENAPIFNLEIHCDEIFGASRSQIGPM